jgi:hypothetical protein
MTFIPSLRILIAGLLGATLLSAQEEKNYRLFVGVDLLVSQNNVKIPVENLSKRDAIVSPAHGDRISLKDVSTFSWARTTKISRSPITISDFEQDRAFSLANDKGMKYLQTQNHMAIYQQEKADGARMAAGEATRIQGAARQVQSNIERAENAGMTVDSRTIEAAQTFLDNSTADLLEANSAMDAQFFESDSMIGDPTFIDKMHGAAGEGGEDVLELTFEISSLVPIAEAYIVVMGVVTQQEEEGIMTFHQVIGAIGPEPRNIKVRKTGFDPGFTIKDINVHVYTNGKEIATNRSEKNFALTREQAREYLLLTHIAQHKRETIGAQPVWTLAPPALLANKSGESFNYPVIVNVDADGSIISIHETETEAQTFLAQIHDEADIRSKSTPHKQSDSFAQSVRVAAEDSQVSVDQTSRVPPAIIAAISDMIFLPALDVGKPITGTTMVNLADFFR